MLAVFLRGCLSDICLVILTSGHCDYCMDQDKKISFLQNMTHLALSHAANVPNVVTPTGGMSHDKMLEFVRKVAEKGLDHMSLGGISSQAGGVLGTPNKVGMNVAKSSGLLPAGNIAGGISNFLGTNNNFQAQGANITPGTNSDQLSAAYSGAQNALGQQQGIANTLGGQLNAGANTQNQLTNMLTQQAQGGGPNPAQAQLNQATGQNIAQQAALAANQRGAGANAGLLASQNAQQGAATQQQAAGQAATLGAQQQLAAQNSLQNLASTQVNQGQNAVQGINNAQQNEQNILQGANTANNNANVANAANINNVNAAISTGNQKANSDVISGLGGIGSAAGSLAGLFASGGEVKKMAMGGKVKNEDKKPVNVNPFNHGSPMNQVHMVKPPMKMAEGGMAGPQSFVGSWLNSDTNTQAPQAPAPANISVPEDSKKDSGGGLASLAPIAMMAMASNGGLMKKGGPVKAHNQSEKADVAGDSLKNDKIPTMLSEGEVVIPRHIMEHPNAPAMAAQFVAQQLAKRGRK